MKHSQAKVSSHFMGLRRSSIRTATACVTFALLLAACGASGPTSGTAAPSTTAAKGESPTLNSSNLWILARNVVQTLLSNPESANSLKGLQIVEILKNGQEPTPGLDIIPAVKFASGADLIRAVNSNSLSPWIRTVIYDPESWAFTPTSEQSDPVAAAKAVFEATSAKGLRLVITPALDLAKILKPNSGPLWSAFLQTGIIGPLAKYADVLEIQSQAVQSNSVSWLALLSAASLEAHRSNPKVVVLGGLSTNPRGNPISASILQSAARLASKYVSGFWFNMPGQGPSCPTCPPANPELAIEFFRTLGSA